MATNENISFRRGETLEFAFDTLDTDLTASTFAMSLRKKDQEIEDWSIYVSGDASGIMTLKVQDTSNLGDWDNLYYTLKVTTGGTVTIPYSGIIWQRR